MSQTPGNTTARQSFNRVCFFGFYLFLFFGVPLKWKCREPPNLASRFPRRGIPEPSSEPPRRPWVGWPSRSTSRTAAPEAGRDFGGAVRGAGAGAARYARCNSRSCYKFTAQTENQKDSRRGKLAGGFSGTKKPGISVLTAHFWKRNACGPKGAGHGFGGAVPKTPKKQRGQLPILSAVPR